MIRPLGWGLMKKSISKKMVLTILLALSFAGAAYAESQGVYRRGCVMMAIEAASGNSPEFGPMVRFEHINSRECGFFKSMPLRYRIRSSDNRVVRADRQEGGDGMPEMDLEFFQAPTIVIVETRRPSDAVVVYALDAHRRRVGDGVAYFAVSR